MSSFQESANTLMASENLRSSSPLENMTRSNKYEYYAEYRDDADSSVVDNLKNISVNQNNINIANECRAEVIAFRMKRFWDGVDLMNGLIQIHYVNSKKTSGMGKVINVYSNNDTIQFLWLIDDSVTSVVGDLTFEITVTGTNSVGHNFKWRTRPNGRLNILEALSYDGLVQPSDTWYTQWETQMTGYVNDARRYSEEAKQYADSVNPDDVENNVYEKIKPELQEEFAETYYNKTQVDGFVKNINQTINAIHGLENLKVSYNNESGELSFKDNDKEISTITINSLNNLKVEYTVVNGKGSMKFKNGGTELFTVELSEINPSDEWSASFKETIETELNEKIDANTESIETLQGTVDGQATNIAKIPTMESNISKNTEDISKNKNNVDNIQNTVNVMNESVQGHTADISDINNSLSALEEKVNGMGDIKPAEYDVNYVDNVFTFYENDEIKQQFTIVGGSGGSAPTSTITVTRDNGDNIVTLLGDRAIIKYSFSSVDNTGDSTGGANVVWRVGNTNVSTSTAVNGSNSYDITDYLKTGTNNIRATFTDNYGSVSAKTWTVNLVEFKVESIFDDSLFYNDKITFRYTPYGDVKKTIHFVLDDIELEQVEVSTSGRQMTYEIQKQAHGSHLLEVYMTATINEQSVKSNSVFKDIVWVDPDSTMPIIGCAVKDFTETQYNNMVIPYVVYDPKNNPSTVQLLVDGVKVSEQTLDRTKHYWSYKSTDFGKKELSIKCGNVTKKITANITELEMESKPVATGLVLDFNPSGKTNDESNWLNIKDDLNIQISDNFDTINGGYQLDSDGDTYFCVKAGTTAVIPFNLFADDAKLNGKNFKMIYKAMNVKDYDAQILSCYDEHSGIGFRSFAQKAMLNSQQQEVSVPYYEGKVDSEPIELEFNILPDKEFKEMVMWLDGIPSRVKLYNSDDNFTQSNPVGITIGSENCDVWIYRLKSYSLNLSDDEILDNFICDAKNANEMIERYQRNLVVDESKEIDPDKLAEVCPDLRVIKLVVPSFTQGKKFEVDGGTIQHIYKGGRGNKDNWTASGIKHKGQGTSSDGYGESARNIDINLVNGIVYDDGTSSPTYDMTDNSIGVNYFNIKVNVASSENANNACSVDDYNTFNPYLRQARIDNPKVRDTMEFHPCVIFLQETDTTTATVFKDGKMHFYACGDIGNSKKNSTVMGNDPENHKEVIIEVSNNTMDLCRFKSVDFSNELWNGDTAFEPRYPSDWKGYSDEEIQAIKTAWQEFVTWVYNSDKETFRAEYKDHIQLDNLLFFYLYTERHLMIDNRAKNTFWHTTDLKHWDVCFNYDNDTCEGNDNEGGLTYTYGLEDTDKIGSKDVFNASDSTIWCKIRDYFPDELQAMYIKLENKQAWNAERILKKYEDYQNVKPERLWIADMRRKYFRPYEDNGTESYLEMMHGNKKHQRRQFEYYQEKYIGSKYKSSATIADKITIRAYTPSNWSGVKPNGDMNIKPYADTYISVMYGSTYGFDNATKATSIRAKRGQTYLVKCPVPKMNDTETYVYNSSMLQSIGDISGCYAGYTDFSNAIKLTDIQVGSDVEGYQNTNMNDFGIGNNILLERLNLQNLPELKKAIDLSNCVNLEEFLADGSGITGVTFASGGKIQKATLPSISSFTAKRLHYLDDLEIESYDNIMSVIIEDCDSIDELEFIKKCPKLDRLRLTNIDWQLEDETFLDKLAKLKGYDENGYNAETSILTGKVHIPSMRQERIDYYGKIWKDLKVSYDTLIPQYTVTFKNYNSDILDVQYVDKGADAVDPITRQNNPIPIPTKESTVSTDYTFDSWDGAFKKVFGNLVITALYTESVRNYTVRYLSKGLVLQTTQAPYGDSVSYDGDMPTYTAEESGYRYYLFKGWDKSEVVDGNKDINAVYDSCLYSKGMFDGKTLDQLSQVEIYAMMKVGEEQNYVNLKDGLTLKLGNDYHFDDIEEKEVITETMTFNGSNYLDTEIKLMDEDRDFTIAIDFTMDKNNSNGSVLAQCNSDNGSDGFKLWCNSSARLTWNSSYVDIAQMNQREIIVLSHKKGTRDITVYQSNLSGESVVKNTLSSVRIPNNQSTLVFGCLKADDGSYEKFCKGKIHWCKVWYACLGEKQCEDIASWIHEEIPMEVAKFKGYYLSDVSSTRCSMTLIAKNLLGVDRRMSNSSSTNDGGWKNSTMNTWMNKRMYNAISPLWKALVQKVKVKSSTGLKSSAIDSSDCYFFIPSIYEINSDYNTDPYIGEVNDTIPYMVSSEQRKRAKVSTPDVYEQYFTRSPNADYNNYFIGITGSENTNAGNVNGYLVPSMEYGVLMMFCIGA